MPQGSLLRLRILSALVYILVINSTAQATVLNVPVTLLPGQTSITINLSGSITNIDNPELTIDRQPKFGTATVTSCSGTNLCVQYTANENFPGADSFVYSVINNDGIAETATISINNTSAQQGNTPEQAINDTLANICLANPTTDLCAAYETATSSGAPEDLRELLDALSPSNVGAQGTLTNELAKEQLASIGRRLAALRHGQRQAALGGLSLRYDNENLSGEQLASLFDELTGGGAGSAGGNWDWFISGKIGGGDQDETLYENGYSFDNYGVTTGVDRRMRHGSLGVAVGYGIAQMDLDHNGGDMDIDGWSATVYGSLYPSDRTYIDLVLGANTYSYDMNRRVIFGTLDRMVDSNTDSTGFSASLGGGVDAWVAGAFTLGLSARLDYVRTVIDKYEEKDTDVGVAIDEQDVSQTLSSLGTQLSYAFSTSWGVLMPQFNAAWMYQFEDNAETIKGYFVSDPDKIPFRFETNTPDSDYFVLGAGISATFPRGASAFVHYETSLTQDDFQIWNVTAGMRLEF